MRMKIGVRLKISLWRRFKHLCRESGLLPRDVLENFISLVVKAGTTTILERFFQGDLAKLELQVEMKLAFLRKVLEQDRYPVGLMVELQELLNYIPQLPQNHKLIGEIRALVEFVKNKYGKEPEVKKVEERAKEN